MVLFYLAFASLLVSTLGDAAWEDTSSTTLLWHYISSGDLNGLKGLYNNDPSVIQLRSKDGRGPLFWAYEYRQPAIIALLEKSGVRKDAQCDDGRTPPDMAPSGWTYKATPEMLAETWELPEVPDDDDEDDDYSYASAAAPPSQKHAGADPLEGIDDDF